MTTPTLVPGARPAGMTTAVIRAEARLFTREVGSLFWIVGFPTILLVILGLIPAFRAPDPALGGLAVIDLYVPVVVLLSMIMASMQAMPQVLGSYRERGILRRLRVTPVQPRTLLLAQVGLHAAATLAAAVLAMTVGRLGFGTPLPQSPLPYLLAYLCALAAALAIGAAITAVAPTSKAATVIGSIIFFPMMFTAGVWAPVQTMSTTLQTIVSYSPMGAAARALSDAASGSWPHLMDFAVMGGWVLVLGAVAVRTFRWE